MLALVDTLWTETDTALATPAHTVKRACNATRQNAGVCLVLVAMVAKGQ